VPTNEQAMRSPLEMGYWVMLVSERAEGAVKRGDHDKAIRYYRALAKAVPDRSLAFTKICVSYRALGDIPNALAACKAALTKAGLQFEDYSRFMSLLLEKPEPLTKDEVADADAVLAHLRGELGKEPYQANGDAAMKLLLVEQIRCELGLRLEDVQRLRACTAALLERAPNDPRTVAFGLALALLERDFDRADAMIAAAKNAGLPGAAVGNMETRVRDERSRGLVARARERSSWLLPGALVLLGVVVLWTTRHRLRLRHVR
jgi:tetratricopeptide (TPR) repeat protein